MTLSMRQEAKLDLSLPRPTLARPEEPPPTTGRREPNDETKEGIERRLHRLLTADRARRNIRQGRVAPALYEIEREASKTFKPKWSLAHGSPRQLGSVGRSLANTLRGLAKSYLEKMETYAKLPAEKESQQPTMLEGYQGIMRAAENEADSLSCELCVTFRLGKEPTIRVERRSENAAFNRLARRALEQALRLQGKEQPPKGEACYRFAAKFHRIPPLPTAGCIFDEVHLRAECFYPFKKILRREVTLLSADEG